MNAKELRDKYHAELRARLAELDAERAEIIGELEEQATTHDEPRATSDDRPRRGWTEERRKAHSRRMRRMHREGKFRR